MDGAVSPFSGIMLCYFSQCRLFRTTTAVPATITAPAATASRMYGAISAVSPVFGVPAVDGVSVPPAANKDAGAANMTGPVGMSAGLGSVILSGSAEGFSSGSSSSFTDVASRSPGRNREAHRRHRNHKPSRKAVCFAKQKSFPMRKAQGLGAT